MNTSPILRLTVSSFRGTIFFSITLGFANEFMILQPPPHLADGYQSAKRPYSGEYGPAVEHRPPYRGARHPYSVVAPPPPPHNTIGKAT